MGHELIYHPDDRHLGSVSLRRWEEVRKLLPLLVDYINRAMQLEWQPGVLRNVRVLAGGGADPPVPPPEQVQPAARPFALERMISEELLDQNEVLVYEAAEWDRLFAWCDFLAQRDGAYALYRPLVEVLRPHLARIAQAE